MNKIIAADTLKPLLGESGNILSREGLNVLWAQKAEEIVYFHKKEKADLIVADFDMPGMPADKLCTIMRADEDLRAVSIIMLYPDTEEAAKRAVSCGANVVVPKPASESLLLRWMTELLNIADRGDMREIVKVAVDLDDKSGNFFGVSRNISTSGMLIETERVLAIGTEVACTFVLDRPVTIAARVVRGRGESAGVHTYGLRFIETDPRSRALIDEFMGGKARS